MLGIDRASVYHCASPVHGYKHAPEMCQNCDNFAFKFFDSVLSSSWRMQYEACIHAYVHPLEWIYIYTCISPPHMAQTHIINLRILLCIVHDSSGYSTKVACIHANVYPHGYIHIYMHIYICKKNKQGSRVVHGWKACFAIRICLHKPRLAAFTCCWKVSRACAGACICVCAWMYVCVYVCLYVCI